MRNTCPLDIYQLINDRLCPIIFFIECAIHSTQRISSQWLALFGSAIYLLLKLSKHRLPEKRPTQVFQRMIENRQAYRRIFSCLQQVLSKQALVQRRSNFGHKDGIVTILEWLIGARKVRMHRMPQFMREGIHTISLVLEVQKDKRTSCISSAAIGPTTFPRSLVDIDPSLLTRSLENIGIVLAQWSKGSHHGITRLLVAYLISRLLNNRHV